MRFILIPLYLVSFLLANEYYYSFGKKINLTKSYELRATNNSNTVYYVKENGSKVGVSNEIIVKCKEDINCKQLLSSQNFANISKLTSSLFLIKLNEIDKNNIFEISRDLSVNTDIKFAHPNFIKNKKRR